MQQLTLDTVAPIRNELERKYRVWLQTHVGVFKLFERFAIEMCGNQRRFSIGMLTERVRWEVATTWRRDEEGYKINNNYRAYIMRDLIAKYPELERLVECRKVREALDNEPGAGV